MAYIANKPVRFDRDYRIGEVIPEDVIAPGMRRKLVEMGRILRVDLPQGSSAGDLPGQPQDAPESGAESAPGGDSSTGEVNTRPEDESPQSGAEDASDGGSGEGAEGQADAPVGTGTGVPIFGELTNTPVLGEFVCNVCGRAFASPQGLAAHSRSHKD